jgi:hypothetical protein
MALPLIGEWIRIQIIDRITPPAMPSLTIPVVFGTTPGIAGKNKLFVFRSPRDALSVFDASTREYQLISKILAQGRMYPAPAFVYAWNINRLDYRAASYITGNIADNNALSWYADKFGDWGERLFIALRNTQANNNELRKTIESKLVVTPPGGNDDSSVRFVQKAPLTDIVRIQYVDPEKPNQELKIVVCNEDGIRPSDPTGYRTLQGFYDYTIKIYLATNAMEDVITTADDIVQALTNPANPAYNPLAASLVDAFNVGNGTGVVAGTPAQAININITIDLADDGALVTTKAWELRDFVNSDPELSPLLLVSNYSVSNGTGTVWEETGELRVPECDPNPTAIADSDTGLRLADNDNVELATEFTISSAIKVSTVYATLRRIGNIAPGKFVWFEIQGDDGGLPDGEPIATTAKVLANSISATYKQYAFKFPQHVSLAAGTYHLVLKGDYAPSTSNYIAVATDDVVSGAPGEIKDAAWAEAPTKKFAFRLFKENEDDPFIHLLRLNTPPSPLELVRGLAALETYAETHKMALPYFYCLDSLDDVEGDRLEFSNAIAAREAIFITTNTEEEAKNVDLIGQLIDSMVSDRTGFAAHSDPEKQRLDAAVVGFFSAIAAAAEAGALGVSSRGMTLFWGKLNAVTPAKWTATERRKLFRNAPGQSAAITYQDDAGNLFITGSWETAGGYLDWRWQKDYIKLRLTLAYYQMMASGPPTYDNPGIGRIESVTINELNRLTKDGFIGAWDVARTRGIYRVNFPRIHQVSPVDFARRTYRFTVQAQPAWAIEQLDAVFEFEFLANVFNPGS